jgi:cytochrome c oxidase subunit 2
LVVAGATPSESGADPPNGGAMSDVLREALCLPEQASSYAGAVDGLHAFIILTAFGGATLVAATSAWFVIRYRRRAGDPAGTPAVRAPRWFELTVIGGLLGLFLLWWWIGFRQFLLIQRVPAEALDIYVTAKQWMWEFAYRDGRASIGVLVVPAGRPVRLTMISRDVIHSFFVPDFRLKHDVVPGHTNLAWFAATGPGIHQLLCAEYCGLEHSRMRGEIVALAPDDYASWLAGETPQLAREALTYAKADTQEATLPTAPARDDLPAQGMVAAARLGCLACHTTDGQRHIGPTFKGLFGSEVAFADGRHAVADGAYLTRSMMDPQADIVAGYANVMPSYQGRLEPADTAALIALITSLAHGRTDQPLSLPQLPAVIPASESRQ